MIKLHASYSKKIPAESQYSSKSFHAALEVEVADDVCRDGALLQERLRALWTDLQDAVEAQIRDSNGNAGNRSTVASERGPGNSSQNSEPASQKQVNFLMSLGRRVRGWNLAELQEFIRSRVGNVGLYDLSKRDASSLIEELQAMKSDGNSGRGGRR